MTLTQYVVHQLREMQREMAIAVAGLSSEELQRRAPGQATHIAWIAQHCCANTDKWLHRPITGGYAIEHTERFTCWPVSPPEEGEPFPDPAALLDRWMRVTEATINAVASLNDSALALPGQACGEEPLAQSFLRVINHQNAHLRQVWMIAGYLGLSQGRWPKQGAWLADSQRG